MPRCRILRGRGEILPKERYTHWDGVNSGGGKTIKETMKTPLLTGMKFIGTYAAAHHEYIGTESDNGMSYPSTLVEGVSAFYKSC